MEYKLFVIARIVHICSIVLWIGGVGFVTTVLIPALRKQSNAEQRMQLFEQLEGRFGLQAKITTVAAGLSGAYMLHFLQAWSRYAQWEFWWLQLMTAVWLIFTLVLFVLEPLFLHRWFHQQAQINSARAFTVLQWMHIVLFSLSMFAVIAAMAASHGYPM
jgi:uncharacterized membrane protein